MAHHLSINTLGLAEMAYRGEKPWHGLGQQVDGSAPVDAWLDAAQMRWTYERSPVMYMNGSMHTRKEDHVIYRSDNNESLSVVSAKYKVVQPTDMLGFFKSLVENEGFSIETVGSMKEGARIWAMANTNMGGEVVAGDEMKPYLLLITSCDGSLATTAKFINTRVVCWNTQAIALHHEVGKAVRVRHNTTFNPDAVKGELGIAGLSAFNSFMDNMRSLSKVSMSRDRAEDFLRKVLPVPVSADKPIEETKGFKTILSLFQGQGMGAALPGVAGTAWGLLNAVTEYTDHHIRARSQENRVSNAWFGPGANLKQDAEDLLLTMV